MALPTSQFRFLYVEETKGERKQNADYLFYVEWRSKLFRKEEGQEGERENDQEADRGKRSRRKGEIKEKKSETRKEEEEIEGE